MTGASRASFGPGTTTLIEGTIVDVRYALRGFMRAPLVVLTIVSTVGLGLGLVAVAFTLLNMFLFRVDQVPNIHEMFAVERPTASGGEGESFTRAHWEALRRESNVFTDAYAELSGIDFPVDGRTLLFTLTTGNFFHVVGVNAAMGRTLTPADDESANARPVMVLSHRGWDRLFGRDQGILGRTVVVKGVSYEIVGVMPEGFRGLAVVPPDYWVPLSMAAQVRPMQGGPNSSDATAGLQIVGRLKPGMSRQTAIAGLGAWASGLEGRPRSSGERRPPSVALVPWLGTVHQPVEALLVTGPLFFAFGLILLIGCANVTNLLLARAVARQREIGIRLSLGAARGRIVRQLLTESLLLALMAAAAGFAISRLALQALVNALLSSWPQEIGNLQLLVPDADWRVLLFLVVGAGIATVCFGLVPALHATRVEPVRTMRGEIVSGETRPGKARGFLIGMQVSASALLLICAGVFLRSALVATTVDPGVRTSDTLLVGIPDERLRASIVQAVTDEPSVAAVAAQTGGLGGVRAAVAEGGDGKATVVYRFVSPELFSVLDIAVVRGRPFARDERTSAHAVAIVSETTARALWPNADPVGQVVRLDPDRTQETQGAAGPALESRTFEVVGVARDVAGFRVAPTPKAVVYLPTNTEAPFTSLVVRVHGDPDRARQALINRLATIDPTMDQVGTMRSMTRIETYFLELGFWSTVGLGGLALALTLSGLFSVLSYLVEQRRKEIGVRMALGATPSNVIRLVLSQSIRPVGIGLIVGSVSAFGLSALLLSTPAADIIGQIVRVRDPIAYVGSLLLILAACLLAASIPATRAAHLDPTRTLRLE